MGNTGTQPTVTSGTVRVRARGVEAWLKPVHRWVWADAHRRAHKLLRFAETEADGGRDLARAAELTQDALLRRLYLRHATDEARHAAAFRARGSAMLASLSRRGAGVQANWLAPGERGLDDLRVDREKDATLLAFLHLSERAAAMRFAAYRDVLGADPDTREVFETILRDEAFHMNYTRKQLERVAPKKQGLRLWLARLHRVFKLYLRFAAAFAGVMGAVVLAIQYFTVLPIFAWAARRAERRARVPSGFVDVTGRATSFRSQY
jgi:hypothetical protein